MFRHFQSSEPLTIERFGNRIFESRADVRHGWQRSSIEASVFSPDGAYPISGECDASGRPVGGLASGFPEFTLCDWALERNDS
jgi:hypothetical protein